MTYDLETKKRKFHQLLDNISNPRQPPQTSATSLDRTSTIRMIGVPSTSLISKRTKTTPKIRSIPSSEELCKSYLPASRSAFLERLKTFRDVTRWHAPSTTAVNAARWAGRGWCCVDIDTVGCGNCSERIVVDLSVEDRSRSVPALEENTGDHGGRNEEDHVDDAGAAKQDEEEDEDLNAAISHALIKRYEGMMVTAHAPHCPWRKTGCDGSIQRIEGLLSASNALEGTKERYNSISDKIPDVPTVKELPSTEHNISPLTDSDMEMAISSQERANPNTVRLAVCGWTYKDTDVIECQHCFRSLGLWLYRGPDPTIEHLDPIDSHLEYCPWRSAEAQDTELVWTLRTPSGQSQGKGQARATSRIKAPGWLLVYHGICRSARRQRTEVGTAAETASVTSGPSLRENNDGDGGDNLQAIRNEMEDEDEQAETAEQTDRKVKDLISRIREARKPFNVKALLSRKKVRT